MKLQQLENLPEDLKSGLITEKEAIDKICCYVAENYPIYGLHKYDEDFRQDIILNLLERASHILHLFNPKFGDFFTFLYCYVSSLINTKVKKMLTDSMKERLNIQESIDSFEEKTSSYHRIDFTNFDLPKAPYAAKSISSEELQQAFKSLSSKQKDKKIIVLALKSSFYITDEQIERICKIYDLKPDYFYSMIEKCKETLYSKNDKRKLYIERRNFAYYHHRRYCRILYNLEDNDDPEEQDYLRERYLSREKKHQHNWARLNNSFQKGRLYLRPTNKTVANLLGICERQVNYYINCAKRDLEKMENSEAGIESGTGQAPVRDSGRENSPSISPDDCS